MTWTPRKLAVLFAITLGIFLIGTVGVFVSRRKKTVQLQPSTNTQAAQQNPSAPPPDNSRAFVRLSGTVPSSERGSNWIVDIQSNSWSSCMADVYRPDGKIQLFENNAEAKAAVISTGNFRWTWHIPRDAERGTWTVRLLCGTFNNLASADRAVEVR